MTDNINAKFIINIESRHPQRLNCYDAISHQYNQVYISTNSGWFVWCYTEKALLPGNFTFFTPNPPTRPVIPSVGELDGGMITPDDPVLPPITPEVPDNIDYYEWSCARIGTTGLSQDLQIVRKNRNEVVKPSLMTSHAFEIKTQGIYRFGLKIGLNDGSVVHGDDQVFRIRDRLVVSIGDSYASGEGLPDYAGQTESLSGLGDQILKMGNEIPIIGGLFDSINVLNSGDAFCKQVTFVKLVEKLRSLLKSVADDNPIGEFLLSTSLLTSMASLYSGLVEWSTRNHAGIGVEWQEPNAHRSYQSGPSRAALQLEDPSSGDVVTFLSFARSGSTITRGLIRPRLEDAAWNPVGQIDEIQQSVGNRSIDALLISIGGNDIGFSMRLEDLVTRDGLLGFFGDPDINRVNVEDAINDRLSKLEEQFNTLKEYLRKLDIPSDRIYLTEYPESLFDAPNNLNGVNGNCGIFGTDFQVFNIDVQDALLIKRKARELNDCLRSVAKRFGWNFIEGIATGFDGHGYCSGQSFFVSAENSCIQQGDFDGVMHPNAAGRDVIATCIANTLRPILFPLAPIVVSLDDAPNPGTGIVQDDKVRPPTSNPPQIPGVFGEIQGGGTLVSPDQEE